MPLSAGSVDTPHTPPSISAPRPRAERAPAPSVSEIRVSLSPVSTADTLHTHTSSALAISDSVYRSTGVLFYSRALALLPLSARGRAGSLDGGEIENEIHRNTKGGGWCDGTWKGGKRAAVTRKGERVF